MAHASEWTIFFYTLSLSITLVGTFYTATRRWVNGAGIFALVLLLEAIWILGNIFELLSPSLEAKLFWDYVQYPPSAFLALGLLAFSLVYQNRQARHTAAWITGLGLVMAVLLLLVLTNGLQGGMRTGARLANTGGLVVLTYPFGPYDLLVFAYAYLLIIIGLIILMRLAYRQSALLRPQTYLIIAGYALPLIGTVFALLNIAIGPQRDSSPIFMAAGNLLVWISLFRYRLFNMLPAARIATVENMQDAMIVVDDADRLVDLNPAAQTLLGLTTNEGNGLPIQQVFPAAVKILMNAGRHEAHDEITLRAPRASGAEERHYELSQLPILNHRRQALGRLLVLHDITTRKRNEEIQRQVHEERILRLSEAKFHMTIEQFTEGFVLVDSTGCVNEWNHAQEGITGISRSQAYGRPYWEIMEQLTVPERRSPQRTDYYRQAVLDTLNTGRYAGKPSADAQILSTSGQRKYIQQTAFPVRMGHEYWIGSATRDITPQKEAQLALERYVARLKILHEIDRAVLAAEHPAEVAAAALEGIRQFVPFHGIGVALAYPLPGGAQQLSCEGEQACFMSMPPAWLEYFQTHPDQKIRIENLREHSEQCQLCPRCQVPLMGQKTADQRLLVALMAQQRITGVLHLCINDPLVFSDEMVEVVQEVGDQLAIAMQQASLLDQTQRRVRELTALHEIALLLNYQRGAYDPLSEMTGHIARLLGGRRCLLLLRDEQNFYRAYNPAFGLSEEEVASIVWQAPDNEQRNNLWTMGYSIVTQPGDLDRSTTHFFNQLHLENVLLVSLWNEDKVLGMIAVCDKPGGFGHDDIQLLTVVATQAAQLIVNTRLFRQLSDAYDATIAGWSKALELREKETQNHSERVTALALKLAQRLEMSADDLDDFSRGVLLHDIGKMGIPDDILLKPGPLDSTQWQIMRQHPRMAYDLLKNIPFLRQALDVPYSHHERWDGSGYPRGLCGEEIPFSARLFAVIDVWDALTNDRPYRSAWSAEETRAYLQANAGLLFDPRIVEQFLAMLQEGSSQ